MAVQYWLGMACQRLHTTGGEERRHLLLASRSCLDEYLRLLLAYQVIMESEWKGNSDGDAAVQRMERIDRMKRVRALEEAVREREGARDEEVRREVELDGLRICALKAVQERCLLAAEIGLLEARLADPHKAESTPTTTAAAARPLPAHIRRVGRPFTLLRTRREDIKASVFRPGHSLPTMTIDEYLELERQRGGILEGGAQEEEEETMVDSDDEGERQRRIRMDEHRDDHRRGSGNTYNRS